MNPTYEVIIYWSSEDEVFIAEVPELPGCAADGTTYAETLANAEVVIREWIETARELGPCLSQPRRRSGRLVSPVGRPSPHNARLPTGEPG